MALFLSCALCLGLTACLDVMEVGSARYDKSRPMTDVNYAAADILIQQAQNFVTPKTPIIITHLTDLDHPGEKTNFGKLAAEQIANRLVQLGYNVSSGEVDSNQEHKVISGTYAVARDSVLVNLRLLNPGVEKVVAAYDYQVPITRNVRDLTKTEDEKESFFDF